MSAAVEAQFDPLVDQALALHALAHARLDHQVDRALLEHARADAPLDVLAAAGLEHHRLDALAVEQLAEHEARRPGADDAHLRATLRGSHRSLRRRLCGDSDQIV